MEDAYSIAKLLDVLVEVGLELRHRILAPSPPSYCLFCVERSDDFTHRSRSPPLPK
jgi:hypothetical protein